MTPVVALVGPTACGKTELALRLAETLPLEVISLDSAQVYRGMDIGTAKPDAAERERLPHHLIDIRDPADPYSAARFATDARALIPSIRARGRIPLIVGGTLLYLRALSDGLSALPAADPGWRARMAQRAVELGWPAMHAELARVDPASAERLNPNDGHRILRALEIQALGEAPASELYRRPPTEPGLPVRCFTLWPPDRDTLWGRIETRFRAMMRRGLLAEVEALYARGDLHASLPSIRAVGYRQLWAHLEGRLDLEEAVTRGIIATRQFAKRQQTWMRALSSAETLPADPDRALIMLRQALESGA